MDGLFSHAVGFGDVLKLCRRLSSWFSASAACHHTTSGDLDCRSLRLFCPLLASLAGSEQFGVLLKAV